jgi:5-methylcytosine-specific restriction endonuclease McrA
VGSVHGNRGLPFLPLRIGVERKEYLVNYRKENKEKWVQYFRDYSSKYTKENKSNVQQRKNIDRKNKKLKAIAFMGGCCKDCGLKSEYESVYDFHHLDPKEKEIGISRLLGNGWEKIKIELEKCVMLCANCHRIRHTKENNNNE